MIAIKNRYMLFATVILLFYILLPVTRILPTFLKGGLLLISIFFAILGVINSKHRYKTNFFTIFLLALIVNLLIFFGEYIQKNDFNFLSKYLVMLIFWIPFAYGSWYVKSNDQAAKNIIKNLIIVLLLLTSITTIIGSILYPEASRLLADGNTEVHRFYQLRNIGGYGFNYALCISVPFLIHMFKISHKIRYVMLIIVFLVCVVVCSYAFAIILFVLISFTSLVFVHRKKRYVLIILFSFIIIVFITYFILLKNEGFWYFILSKVEDNSVLYQRIGDLSNFFLNKNMTGDVKYRNYLYSLSVDAFKKSPFFGNLFGQPNELSGHSEVLDYLGGTGIFGIIIILFLLLKISNNYKLIIMDNDFNVAFIILTIVMLLLSLLNTVVGSVEITGVFAFLYLPINSLNNRKTSNVEVTRCIEKEYSMVCLK